MSSTATDAPVQLRTFARAALNDWLLPSRTMQRRFWPAALGLAYIAVIDRLGGLRSDHVLLGLLGLLDLYNENARRFLRAFFPFILTGAIFDSMRYYYWQGVAGRVHVAEPYLLERAWFGIGGRTPNELFLQHHWTVLDVACGFAYLVYVAAYLALPLFLFFRGQVEKAVTFGRCFLVVNVMGFATYFVYAAAPPWYVSEYGLGPARMDVGPTAAAGSRFDAFFGTQFFESMYGRGIDVFGALPSLHVAYPLMAILLAFRIPALRWARWPAVFFFLLMCLSAVYLQHHYVIDELLGFVYALAAVAMVSAWERRRSVRPGRGSTT